jgi:phage terminase small subunit
MGNITTNEYGLTPKEEKFCHEYVLLLSPLKAAINAGYSEKSASNIGSIKLTKARVRKRIETLKKNLGETAEISALRVLKEHEKIAFADAGQLRSGWLDLKAFEQLTPDQKAVIQEITTKETRFGTEYKIRLYDKQKSLDSISAMLGFNAPEKTEITVKEYDLNSLTDEQRKTLLEIGEQILENRN